VGWPVAASSAAFSEIQRARSDSRFACSVRARDAAYVMSDARRRRSWRDEGGVARFPYGAPGGEPALTCTGELALGPG
jgi:hypothetical protein